MKLLHTADWHIGRQLNNNGISLLEDQAHVLEQIIDLAKKEAVDGVIIAGDLYDRGLPPVEAVSLFNQTLNRLLFEAGVSVYAITGNHDSAKRLEFGQEFFKRQGFHLVSKLADSFQPIELEEVQIFLLPFIDPIDARIYYQDSDISTMDQAISRIIADMKKLFNPAKKQVLVSHFAVSKGADDSGLREQMLSETTRTVGGLATLTSDLFADFDYVALGHIHTRFASPTERIVYSGSPLIFNKDEAKRQDIKGAYLVEISVAGVRKTFHPLKPSKDFLVLEASYQDLLQKDFYEKYPRKKARFAFDILVEDRKDLEGINVRAQLEEIYGEEIIDLRIKETRARRKPSWAGFNPTKSKLAEDQLIATFFAEMTGGDQLSAYQKSLVQELLGRGEA